MQTVPYNIPFVPVLDDITRPFLLDEPEFVKVVDVEGLPLQTAPLRFGPQLDLLGLSHAECLLEAGVIDISDSLGDAVVLDAVYLTHPTKPTVRASVIATRSSARHIFKSIKFQGARTRRRLGIAERVQFTCKVGDENMDFEVPLKIVLNIQTSHIHATVDGKITVLRQSPEAVRNQPLANYTVTAFDLSARRVNYNRRMAA